MPGNTVTTSRSPSQLVIDELAQICRVLTANAAAPVNGQVDTEAHSRALNELIFQCLNHQTEMGRMLILRRLSDLIWLFLCDLEKEERTRCYFFLAEALCSQTFLASLHFPTAALSSESTRWKETLLWTTHRQLRVDHLISQIDAVINHTDNKKSKNTDKKFDLPRKMAILGACYNRSSFYAKVIKTRLTAANRQDLIPQLTSRTSNNPWQALAQDMRAQNISPVSMALTLGKGFGSQKIFEFFDECPSFWKETPANFLALAKQVLDEKFNLWSFAVYLKKHYLNKEQAEELAQWCQLNQDTLLQDHQSCSTEDHSEEEVRLFAYNGKKYALSLLAPNLQVPTYAQYIAVQTAMARPQLPTTPGTPAVERGETPAGNEIVFVTPLLPPRSPAVRSTSTPASPRMFDTPCSPQLDGTTPGTMMVRSPSDTGLEQTRQATPQDRVIRQSRRNILASLNDAAALVPDHDQNSDSPNSQITSSTSSSDDLRTVVPPGSPEMRFSSPCPTGLHSGALLASSCATLPEANDLLSPACSPLAETPMACT